MLFYFYRDRESRPLSARSEKQQQISRPSSNRSVTQTSITPVKISRRDLRLMSDVEVSMRRSNASHGVSSPQPQGTYNKSYNASQLIELATTDSYS